MERSADLVRRTGPDIVALQEADGASVWSGNFDHVERIARLTELEEFYRGDHSSLELGRLSLSYGTALLSKLPLRDPASRRFDANWRDTKGYVVATVAVPEWSDQEVDVASVHLDFLTPSVRREQIARLIDDLAHRTRPLVVMGDLNCCWQWERRSMELLIRHLGLHAHEPDMHAPTYPARKPMRRLDWVLASRELRFSHYRTEQTPLSDHLAVVAEIQPR